jgi:predicted nucleotidyltransferase
MASLATASLTDAERRALDRLVDALQRELGDDLHAVWLYGSRARGEPQHEEGSDIDLLVITSPGTARRERIQELVTAAAKAEGVFFGWFSHRPPRSKRRTLPP